jgi:hypothetical protein
MTLDELLKTPKRIIDIAFAVCCDHPTSLDAACATAITAVRRDKAANLSEDFIIELVGRMQAQLEADKHPVKPGLDSHRMFGFPLGDILGKQLKPLAKLYEHLAALEAKQAKG